MALATLCLLALGMGCKTPGSSGVEAGKAYAVHAVFIDVSTAQLKDMNLLWLIEPSRTANAAGSENSIEKLRASRQAKTTEFPMVYLNTGERRKIDSQKPVKYSTAHTMDGKPTGYTTRGVGRLIEIDLKSVTNDIAKLSCHIEDVDDPTWKSFEYNVGTTSRKMKLPTFHVRSIDSDLALKLNNWMIAGGLVAPKEDGSKLNTIICIQVLEMKNAGPSTAITP